MSGTKGTLSVESENIFPVIKKWLYTEQDIFVRELISNGADAITKVNKLAGIGEYKPNPKEENIIRIEINQYDSTIKFSDNGIGMDADEIDKYINQIAFSGASDFLNQYKDEADNQIIGHFGLGFYSSFMAADRVEIDSLSYRPLSIPVHWQCDSQMTYEMEKGKKDQIGTTVTLHVDPRAKYLNPEYMERIINKFFAFFPTPIELSFIGEPTDTNNRYGTRRVNDTNPLWIKRPEECRNEEYIDFFQKAFKTGTEPVLWVHLYNEELGVKGLIFFRNKESFELSIDGQVKLYSNQVYITDDAKGFIPEFLFLQNAVIDCRELPLMVSRSAVQKSENVNAITNYIVEQIAFKLYGTFECERDFYESIWDSLNPFIKFSCLKDKLFASYIEKFIIFKTISGKYVTLKEHLEDIKAKHENIIYYISDDIQQAHYINTFKKAGIDALFMTHVVDQPYIKKLEVKDTNLRFNRIDSDFCEALKEDLTEEAQKLAEKDEKILTEMFNGLIEDKHLSIKASRLITKELSSVMVLNEEERRVRDTIEMYKATGMDVSKFSYGNDVLLLNLNHKLVEYLLKNPTDHDLSHLVKLHLIDIARLGQETLEAEQMSAFIDRSNMLLELVIER